MTDFSRRGVIEKQKNLRSVSKRLNSKLWVTVFRLFIIFVIGVSIIIVMAGFGAFNGLKDSSPIVELVRFQETGLSSTAYYSDGTVSQVFAGAEANRKIAEPDEIPKVVKDCLVAIEDERFYQHSGIDIKTIFRSGISSVKELGTKVYGGSTITQQLLKNVIFGGGNEKTFIEKVSRKIQEQFLAVQIEQKLLKDEIICYYLNDVDFGNHSNGIAMAAENYFGKDVSELTLSEASVIVPIVLTPTYLNPVTHPEENAERRLKCLDKMVELGFCTQEERDEALRDDVYTRIALYNQTKGVKSLSIYSYFTDELVEQIYEDLQTRLGYTYEQAKNKLFYGGLTIKTTQNREMQEIMDRYYTDESNFPIFGFESGEGSAYEIDYALSVYHADGTITHYHNSDLFRYFEDWVDSEGCYYHKNGGRKGISELTSNLDDINAKIEEFKSSVIGPDERCIESKNFTPQPQSSMTIMDQKTGQVLALYGGRGPKKASMTLNRATNTTRSVGSTFKVLASFLPAIDSCGVTLASVQDDSPLFYPGTDKEVVNWYTTGFRGYQSVRTGIYNSLNVVAVKNIIQIGPAIAFEYLEKLGFTTLVRSETRADGSAYTDIGPALALGGLTKGVTNLELTAAYAAIANGGVYCKPYFYTEILDKDGNVLLSNTTESRQVMKTSTAWLLTSAMEDTITLGGNQRSLGFETSPIPVAGKTGTATGNNDFWFAGFTPYYTAAIWTGYDNNFEQINSKYQQYLWRNIMEDIHLKQELPYADFPMPDSIVTATICTKCGNLAVPGLCDEADSYNHESCVKTEYFAKGTAPTTKCTCHVKVSICKETGKLATEYCPESERESVVLMVKDENYVYSDTQMEILEKEYDMPITTRDTPYLYKPTEVCEKHLPAGLVVNGYGQIVTVEEYEAELAALAAAEEAENAAEND